MPTVSHASLTADADLHEPKGAASAAANTVYIADGAGSGSFQNPITALDLVADSNAAINTSFTPVLRFGGTDFTASGGTFSLRDGRFTRIASLVLCVIRFTLTNKGSATGAITIDLPHDNIISGPATASITSGASLGSIVCTMTTGTDRFNLANQTSTTVVSLTDANFTNSTDIIVFGMYGLSS